MMMMMISAILMRKLIIYSTFEHMFVKMVLNLLEIPIENEFMKIFSLVFLGTTKNEHKNENL